MARNMNDTAANGTATNYGRRLIPHVVDELAAQEPDRIVYSIALSANISHGFRDVSARNFADAVNKTAWWLHGLVGKSDSFETIAYIGPHDIRYFLIVLACVKVGYKALFLSPNNSKAGAQAIIRSTTCKLWVHPKGQPHYHLLEELRQECGLAVLEMPEEDELLDADMTEHYPYTKTFDEAIAEPFCVLHSSGSTGLPKAIMITHGLVATVDAVPHLPPTDGDHNLVPWATLFKKGDRLYCPNILLHASATIVNILSTFFFGTQSIMHHVDVEPGLSIFESLADHGRIDIWFVLPQYLNELGQAPEILRKFESSKLMAVAGGPMSPKCAAVVNKVIRVFNLTGTTEGFMIGNLLVDCEDFLYFAFHPYSGFDFREIEPDIYEHWVVRTENWSLFQGIFHTFPNAQEVNLKDRYVKHPTKPDHWLYYGRSDDIIALADGIKISPIDVEETISAHPAVSGCIMVGTGQKAPALLVELREPKPNDSAALGQLLATIQTQIEKADTHSLYKGYLHKDCIIFADPARPFKRTDKLTIKRPATLDLYHRDIEEFYINRGDKVGWAVDV